MLWTVREVDGSQLWNVPPWKRYHNLEQSILQFWKLSLGLQPLIDQGDEKGVEKGDVVFEQVDSFVPGHHDRMVTEELLLSCSAVDVEKQRILVEWDLRRDSQHEVSFGELPAVDLVLGETALDATT